MGQIITTALAKTDPAHCDKTQLCNLNTGPPQPVFVQSQYKVPTVVIK